MKKRLVIFSGSNKLINDNQLNLNRRSRLHPSNLKFFCNQAVSPATTAQIRLEHQQQTSAQFC